LGGGRILDLRDPTAIAAATGIPKDRAPLSGRRIFPRRLKAKPAAEIAFGTRGRHGCWHAGLDAILASRTCAGQFDIGGNDCGRLNQPLE